MVGLSLVEYCMYFGWCFHSFSPRQDVIFISKLFLAKLSLYIDGIAVLMPKNIFLKVSQ